MFRLQRSFIFSAMMLLSPAAAGQTPSEVQRLEQFAGGGGVAAALEVEGIYSIRGRPGFIQLEGPGEVLPAVCESGVWRWLEGFTGSGGTPGMRFGRSAAMEGDLLVVGATLDDPNGTIDAGSAFIFILDQETNEWVQVQKLVASNGAPDDSFGRPIAIEGTTIVVGASGRGDPRHGAVYVFELIDGVWQETQMIVPDDIVGEPAEFGNGLDIDGGRIAVGSPGFQRVYVFEKDANGIWQETFSHTGFMGDAFAEFGHSVDIEGNRMVVGAPFEDHFSGGVNSGDFRVFDFDGTTWQITWNIPYTFPLQEYEKVGYSVALADGANTIILGAPEGFKEFLGDGHLRVFRFVGGEWIETALIRPTDQNPQMDQKFGTSMAVDGNWLMVAAPGDGSDSGAAYMFDLTGQLGTRARLTDATVQFGSFLSGSLESLRHSSDTRYRIRSRFNFTGTDTTIADLRIGATNYVANPALLNLLIEGRITQAGGTMKVRLRDWNTNAFDQVHQYAIGAAENVVQVSDIPAANYIRPSDNRVEVSLRASALVNFATLGFEEQIDFVNVLVKD